MRVNNFFIVLLLILVCVSVAKADLVDVTVNWEPAATGGEVLGFRVTRGSSPDPTTHSKQWSIPDPAARAFVVQVDNDLTTYIGVKAYNALGESSSTVIGPIAKPGAPINVTVNY